MGRLKRKFLFGDLYNMGAYEEYFAEMSRKGLHLERVGSLFAYFKEGDPDYLNYRIDMFKKDEKDIKIREHKEKGWKFISNREPFLIFSSKENSGLEELYETPEEQRLALKHALKDGIKGILTTILGILTIFILIYMRVEIDRGLFLGLARGDLLITILPILMTLFISIRQRWHISRILSRLKSGEFLSHYGNYYLGKISFIFSRAIFTLLVVLAIYYIYQGGRANTFKNRSMEELPIISLEEIEGKVNNNSSDPYSYLYENWSLLVPKGYELWENFEVDEYKSSLSVDYYLGRFNFIARGLEKDLLSNESERFDLEANKILEKDGLYCYGGEDENRKILICRKDLQVILLRYFDGDASLDEIMNITIKELGK